MFKGLHHNFTVALDALQAMQPSEGNLVYRNDTRTLDKKTQDISNN